MKQYCFGVDIGGTAIKLGLFETSGELVEKWMLPTRREQQSQYVLLDIAESIQQKCRGKGISTEEILGIGYGVPGIVSADGVVIRSGNLEWQNKPVTKELTELTGLPVKGGNDVNTAALGEWWQGAAKGYENVVMLTLGTGIGGAVIADGRLIIGATGGAGEIGHIHVEDACSIPCACGGCGCAQQFSSATGVVRMAGELLAESDIPSILRNKEITAKDVFDAVKAGGALAKEVAEKFGKYLGKALATVVVTVEPELFLIGGGVSKAGNIILDYIRKYYKAYAYPGFRNKPFVLAELGNDAGIYGAAAYFLNIE